MKTILESFTQCMAFENGIDIEAARSMVNWLQDEGALDYATLTETYQEPATSTGVAPTVHLVANDA